MFIYMSEDGGYIQLLSLLGKPDDRKQVWLKAGITRDPKQRRYGLNSYAKKFGIEDAHLTIDKHTIEVTEDMALAIEAYVLCRIKHMPSVTAVHGELAYISLEDREVCYRNFPIWVQECVNNLTRKGA